VASRAILNDRSGNHRPHLGDLTDPSRVSRLALFLEDLTVATAEYLLIAGRELETLFHGRVSLHYGEAPMCDYSLAEVRTRLVVEGEDLTVYRFPTGTLGFTSPAELEQCSESRGWRSWFSPQQVPCAVCIPCGAQLVLRDIPRRLRSALGLEMEEEVVFVQIGIDAGRHRDAVRFRNNQEVLLQRLAEGQRARAVSLGGTTSPEENLTGIVEPV